LDRVIIRFKLFNIHHSNTVGDWALELESSTKTKEELEGKSGAKFGSCG